MHTKLTLRLEEHLIDSAKAFARRQGKSLSRIVADYFASLARGEKRQDNQELPPLTKALKGTLRGARIQEGDYRHHLEEKHL